MSEKSGINRVYNRSAARSDSNSFLNLFVACKLTHSLIVSHTIGECGALQVG